MTDKLIIKSASFLVNIGHTEEERKKKQRIFVDAELFLDTRKAGRTDNLEDTVNYVEVHKEMKTIIESRHHILIESLAEKISGKILERFSIHKINITIKKPQALAQQKVRYAAIEITRKK